MKKCTKCKEEKGKNIENFSWIKQKNRFEAQCRECRTKRRKEVLQKKIKLPRKKRKLKEEHHFKEVRKKWICKNREKIKRQLHQNYLKNKHSVLLRSKKWREENKEKFKISWGKSKEKNKEKYVARRLVRYEIEKGTMLRKTQCEVCKKPCHTDAHHEDYSKPFEVQWLCKTCHGFKHRKYKE